MINARFIKQDDRYLCCDCCNRYLPVVVIYNLMDSTGKASWNRFVLCEDCSVGLSNIAYNTIQNEGDYVFDPHTENVGNIIRRQ